MAQFETKDHIAVVDGKTVVVQGTVDAAGRTGVRIRVLTGDDPAMERFDRFVPITFTKEEARQVAVGIVKALP